MEESMVKVDKRFVFHLAVAAVACSVQSFILEGKLDFVLRAVLAHRDATLSTVVMLFAPQFELFEFAEGDLAQGTLTVICFNDLTVV